MPTTHEEIAALEDRLHAAELVTDPAVFETFLADDALIHGQDGKPYTKPFVVQAHSPAGKRPFSRYESSEMRIVDLGDAVVVTLRVDLQAGVATHHLRFTRVWARRDGRWQVVAAQATNIAP